MLIFDNFPTVNNARAFANYCKSEFARDAQVFHSQDESNKVDIFPFTLYPPIVLVERNDDPKLEQEIITLVSRFNGTFAGT